MAEQQRPYIVVTRRVPQPALDALTEHAELRIWEEDVPIPRETLLEWIPGADGLYCLLTDTVDAEVLDAAGPGLKVISQMAVGYDNIDVAACTGRGIPVGHKHDVLTETTADLTTALWHASACRLRVALLHVRA